MYQFLSLEPPEGRVKNTCRLVFDALQHIRKPIKVEEDTPGLFLVNLFSILEQYNIIVLSTNTAFDILWGNFNNQLQTAKLREWMLENLEKIWWKVFKPRKHVPLYRYMNIEKIWVDFTPLSYLITQRCSSDVHISIGPDIFKWTKEVMFDFISFKQLFGFVVKVTKHLQEVFKQFITVISWNYWKPIVYFFMITQYEQRLYEYIV